MVVDLVTNLSPGTDFDQVRTRLVPGDAAPTVDIPPADVRAEAERIAEFRGLSRGTHRLEVELLRRESVIASRTTIVTLNESLVVTVVITARCVGVVCEGEETCVRGSCAPADCSSGGGPDCPEPECTSASECSAPAACAEAACVEGACVAATTNPCAMGICSADEGCRLPEPAPDAGPPDAGQPDGGPPDAGPPPPDTLVWIPCSADANDAAGRGAVTQCAAGQCPTMGSFDGHRACRFDGVDDHIEIDPFTVVVTNRYTLTAWAHLDVLDDSAHILSRPVRDSGENTYGLFVADDTSPMASYTIASPAGSTTIAEPAPELETRWVHIAGATDGTTIRLYVDGTLRQSGPNGTISADAHPILIGANEASGERIHFWNGWLRDIRIYDRELSDAEIAALAAE